MKGSDPAAVKPISNLSAASPPVLCQKKPSVLSQNLLP